LQGWNPLENGIPVRFGPAGNGPVGIICPTGEIPAKTDEIPVKTDEIPVKTGEKVTIFLENNFLQKNDPKYEII
jgi:hypothetical protein